MKKPDTPALILIFILAFSLAACSNDKTGHPADNQMTGSVSAYPVTIVDANGSQITIGSEPETIISVAPNMTEIVYALAAEDKLTARSEYCDYPEAVSDIESIGSITDPDIERIVELDPDLVLTSALFDDENAAKLEALGITVLSLYEPDSFEGSYALIQKTGRVLNRTSKADEVIAQMQNEVSQVLAAAEHLTKPTVYYVVGFGEYGDYTAGGDTFIGQMIELAGGENIADDVKGWSYNLENLLEADPDIIILSAGMKDSFVSAGGYSELSAVKNGRVVEMDTDTLERQGVRNAEGLRALAEIFHPEIFDE